MKHTWYPDDYVASTYQIDFAQLAKEGYRGVIFDVDNTLVEHNAPADERAIAFFTMLHDNGYKALLLSNNAEPRVQSFKDKRRQVGALLVKDRMTPTSIRQESLVRSLTRRLWRFLVPHRRPLSSWETRFLPISGAPTLPAFVPLWSSRSTSGRKKSRLL